MAAETVNCFVPVSHVPPTACHVPLPVTVAAEMGVYIVAAAPTPARIRTAPLLAIVPVPPLTLSRLPLPTSMASSD